MIQPCCCQGWFCCSYRLQPLVPRALEGTEQIAGFSRDFRGDDKEETPHVPQLALRRQSSIPFSHKGLDCGVCFTSLKILLLTVFSYSLSFSKVVPLCPKNPMSSEDVSQPMHRGHGQPQQLGAPRLSTCCDVAAEGLSPTPGNTAATLGDHHLQDSRSPTD